MYDDVYGKAARQSQSKWRITISTIKEGIVLSYQNSENFKN